MVDVWIPYGKTEICVRIPPQNFIGLIEPIETPGLSDPTGEIVRALKEPIGSPKLFDTVKPDQKVAIVVDDITRPAPSHLLVPPILAELTSAGVKNDDITIIFGCGAHRAVTKEETTKLFGEEIDNVNIINHDCKAKDLVYIGTTQKHGVRVYVNHLFAEADVRILTGDICFHYYAGYGGGRKSVLPAVTGEETINNNHSMLLHSNAKTGILSGNPVSENMLEAAKLAKIDFILNVVINNNGKIVKAFAGDLEKAFNEGVKLVDEMYRIPVARKADIVIVSPGGYPADINLYQAYKGINAALKVVKRNGVIILAAECSEGHGNEQFYEWMLKYKDLKSVERKIRRKFVLGGHKAYYFLKALEKTQIILVSLMPDYYVMDIFKLKTARTVNDALNIAFNIVKKKAKVLVISHGNFILPQIIATNPALLNSKKHIKKSLNETEIN